MESIIQIFQIVNGLTALFAIIVATILYVHGLNREKRLVTIKFLSEIRTKYFNPIALDNMNKLYYLNELEYLATGINANIYDIKIVKKMSGSELIKQYDDFLANFILYRRMVKGNNKTFREYEEMIKKLKAIK